MKNPFHDFLIEILDQIDGNEADKEDMYEELLIHLQLTADDFIQKGYDNKQAVQMAKELFGESQKIGNVMQEAMFPKRKMLLLLLSLASMFYSISVYLAHLILEGNASFIWLFLSMGSSSILLLYALPILPALNRKKWLNTSLIIHIFMYLSGMLLATSLYHSFSVFLTLFALVIMLYTMVMIYRTTIFDFQYSNLQNIKPAKQLHFLNITSGIVIISFSLYYFWIILVFSETFSPFMLLILTPIIIWIGLYTLQIKLVVRNKVKTAYSIAIIPFSLLVIIVIWIIWSSLPGGNI